MNNTFNYINLTINNSSQLFIKDCGTLISEFSKSVDFNMRLVSIVLFILIIFEWWALNKVNRGKLTIERRENLTSFILIFIHALILFGSFYLMYFIVLAKLDF